MELIKKLEQIKALADECLEGLSSSTTPKHKSVRAKTVSNEQNASDTNYIIAIVNKIKNCDETDSIESEVLDKSGMAERVLLPFYICYKYFPDQPLTTGDIEKITSELRVKITKQNVGKKIRSLLFKYLAGDSTPVKGKPTLYKLNRKGAAFFESILNTSDD